MLVTFTCKAFADITMFGNVAEQLLQMMGHSGDIPGAILAEDVPGALQKLKQALTEHSTPDQDESDDGEHVSLDHRALPLLGLLEAAAREKCEVMWRAYGK